MTNDVHNKERLKQSHCFKSTDASSSNRLRQTVSVYPGDMFLCDLSSKQIEQIKRWDILWELTKKTTLTYWMSNSPSEY